jgi:hypothetical protein
LVLISGEELLGVSHRLQPVALLHQLHKLLHKKYKGRYLFDIICTVPINNIALLEILNIRKEN